MKLKSLKHYLQNLPTKDIISYLINKHRDQIEEYEKDVDEKLKNYAAGYAAVIEELLSFEPSEEQQTIELVLVKNDFLNEYEDWVKVLIQNNDYVKEPPENLKIWGGKEDENDCPDGHYNVNWRGYNKHYGISGLDRNKLLDNPIEIEQDAFEFLDRRIEAVVGEILHELTFQGFLEEDCKEFWDEMNERVKNTKKEDYLSWDEVKKIFEEEE